MRKICQFLQVCGKKFMEKGGLQRHVKIHSEEKAHICHVCGKGFVLVRSYKLKTCLQGF